jgi:hypothetical protein
MLKRIQTAYSDAIGTARQLIESLNRNSTVTEQSIALAHEIRTLLTSQAVPLENTAESCRYLAASERHRRHSAGHPFEL